MASAIAKSFRIIRLLRQSRTALPLGEIARSVGVAPSTAYSILGELAGQGAVLQDGKGHYALGPAMFYLGAAYARELPIVRTIWMDLVHLGDELSLTAVVAVPWEDHHLMVGVHDGGGVEVALAGRVPIDAGSFGKAYFAEAGAAPPDPITAFTPNTITDPDAYKEEVAQVSRAGYATDREEFGIGVGGVCCGVTGQRGFEGIAALLGTIDQLTAIGFEEVGTRLGRLADRASYALGDPTRRLVVGAD